MESHRVELYIYDLSGGMAAQLSQPLIGKQIDGIWHTAIVVYNREYLFGSRGVESCDVGCSAAGPPKEIKYLGETQVPQHLFVDYLAELSTHTYTPESYNILTHNCNNFSEEVAQFLCGVSIPKYILELPNEVLNANPMVAGYIALIAAQIEKSMRPIEEEHQRFSRENSPETHQ